MKEDMYFVISVDSKDYENLEWELAVFGDLGTDVNGEEVSYIIRSRDYTLKKLDVCLQDVLFTAPTLKDAEEKLRSYLEERESWYGGNCSYSWEPKKYIPKPEYNKNYYVEAGGIYFDEHMKPMENAYDYVLDDKKFLKDPKTGEFREVCFK